MLKGIVSGSEKDITRIPMLVGNEYQEGWEVRDNQNRLIWGREDELQTTTGTLPLKGYGLPVKVESLLGAGQQTGTPTPDNPIQPEFVGVRTGNLFDKTFTSGYHLATNGKPTEYTNDTRCAILKPIDVSGVSTVTFSFTNTSRGDTKKYMYSLFNGSTLVTRVSNQESGSTIDVSQGDKLYLCVYSSLASVNAAETTTNTMLNSGGTALPYEPYGWAEKITCAGQTVPVYLGQTQTVRRIRKLVLTGDETTWSEPVVGHHRLTLDGYMRENTNIPLCTHYIGVAPVSAAGDMYNLRIALLISASGNNYMYIRDSAHTSIAGFKSYLAQQYAAGTPVTVWYVLAEPETGIVNEPLCKIGDYADELNDTMATLPEIPTTIGQNTLTVDTTLAPSNLTVKGHIKTST